MKLLFMNILFLILIPSMLMAQKQINCTHIKQYDLPKGISFKGSLKDALRWSDKEGVHFTLITETGEYPSIKVQNENYRDAELFAYDYLVEKDRSVRKKWGISDFVKNCPVDINANFVKNTFQITDLNADGVGEIWIMYKVGCSGDISPIVMKLIMYQGQKKYAMRGRSRIELSANEKDGGEFLFDNAFLCAPYQIKDFARKIWSKNVIENVQ